MNLVYRDGRRGKHSGPVTHKTLADPEVVGITVERTLWNLYVPGRGAHAGYGGQNMEQVLDEVNETEKLVAECWMKS